MTVIFTGMLSPEKMGVRGSRWMILEEDTLTITSLQNYPRLIEEMKARDCVVIIVDNDVAKLMVERFM